MVAMMNIEATKKVIKVCPNPMCDAVWHNVPKKHTRCNDCGGHIMQINEDTYQKKFSNNFFQYDFETGEYLRPEIKEVNNAS
jgi:hypothetical protein